MCGTTDEAQACSSILSDISYSINKGRQSAAPLFLRRIMSSQPINKKAFSPEAIRKYNEAAENAMEAAESIPLHDIHVFISTTNAKTGNIPSFSTLSGITCVNCQGAMQKGGCGWYCYDKGMVINMGRKNMLRSRALNTRLVTEDPERAFEEISKECYKYKFFRWHVGGEIIDAPYVSGMNKVAVENPHCEFLVFTKNHRAVNRFTEALIQNDMDVAPNFHIIFSAWPGMPCDNPYEYPEASPLFADGTSAFSSLDNCHLCGNSCRDCLLADCGCFNATKGQKVLFNLH